jgi:1-acyl-sn-glycerol-3-phosphate acyltransferase
LLKKVGAIPIDRNKIVKKRRTMADTIVDMFNSNDQMYVLMQPEGTRKYVPKWKLGFYHVAVRANVPMILTYIDYPSNTGGFGPIIYPSGDMQKDLDEIRAFYKTIRGKYPENGIK